MNIYQKLIEVRKEVPYIQKADKGAQYSYTGSSRVLGSLKRKMDELGLLLIPAVTNARVSSETVENTDRDGKNKKTTTYFTELEMTMTWVNAENPEEKIVSPWYAQGVDIAGEKGVGKAMTYGEKYFLLKFFNIATDKDDPDTFQKKFEDEDDKPEPKEPPASLRAKYQMGKGDMDGFDEWAEKMKKDGYTWVTMEQILTERLMKKTEAKTA